MNNPSSLPRSVLLSTSAVFYIGYAQGMLKQHLTQDLWSLVSKYPKAIFTKEILGLGVFWGLFGGACFTAVMVTPELQHFFPGKLQIL